MTYKELVSEYFVLAPLKRQDTNFLLCRSINNLDYAFFTLKDNEYVPVNDNLLYELSSLYKQKHCTMYKYRISRNLMPYKDKIIDTVGDAVSYISNFLDTVDPSTKQSCLDKINELTIKHYTEDDIKEELDPDQTMAYFRSHNNTIFIANSESLDGKHILLHEMMHCVAQSDISTTTGLVSYYKRSHFKSPSHEVIFNYGTGLNEGATEFYASMLLNEAPQSYCPEVNIFTNLRNECNIQIVDKLYLKNKPATLKEHIAESFHYKDTYMVEKLFAQVDAINILLNEDYEITEKLKMDYMALVAESYKTLIDMNIHKCIVEKKDYTNKKLFGEFFTAYGLDVKGSMFKQLNSILEQYFETRKLYATADNSPNTEQPEYSSIITQILCIVADNKLLSPHSFPEEYKNMDFYTELLNRWAIRTSNEKTNETKKIKEKTLKMLLSEQYLPLNPKIRDDLVYTILSNHVFKEMDAHRYLPHDTLLNVLNRNPKYALNCFHDNPISFLPDIVCGFSSQIKTDVNFYTSFISALKKLSPRDNINVLQTFYNTLQEDIKYDAKLCEFLQCCIIDYATDNLTQYKADALINEIGKNYREHQNGQDFSQLP